MEAKGARNVYNCGACRGRIVTVLADDGVTPAMLACQATVGCKGTMLSTWYMDAGVGKPTHEWFRPTDISKYGAVARAHFRMGGLELRAIPLKAAS